MKCSFYICVDYSGSMSLKCTAHEEFYVECKYLAWSLTEVNDIVKNHEKELVDEV